MNKLVEQLKHERPDTSARKLAKELNLSHSYVNDILTGRKPITWNFAAIVAERIGLAPLEAFQLAGLLPVEEKQQG